MVCVLQSRFQPDQRHYSSFYTDQTHTHTSTLPRYPASSSIYHLHVHATLHIRSHLSPSSPRPELCFGPRRCHTSPPLWGGTNSPCLRCTITSPATATTFSFCPQLPAAGNYDKWPVFYGCFFFLFLSLFFVLRKKKHKKEKIKTFHFW